MTLEQKIVENTKIENSLFRYKTHEMFPGNNYTFFYELIQKNPCIEGHEYKFFNIFFFL